MTYKTMMFWMLMGLLPAATLEAATQVQEEMGTYGGNGFFSWNIKTTSAYGDARHRSDTERDRFFSSTPEKRVEIERVDLDKIWTIDPHKKRYTEESISAAREKAKKDMEKNRAEWDKKKKDAKPEKEAEPTMRIKSAVTKVTGPGAAETINGFSCHPYTIKTVIEYESLPDHKSVGIQTIYEKRWTTDSPLLAQYQSDELAFWKSQSKEVWSRQELKEIQDAMKQDMAKAEKDSAANPWLSYANAASTVKGYPVRTLFGFTYLPKDGKAEKPAAKAQEAKDDSIVQPGDFSGGVSGFATGIAGRWASKKVEKKVQQKMEEHPAWIDELSKDLDNQGIGWGWTTEVKSVTPLGASTDLFEVPAGYKKVNSL